MGGGGGGLTINGTKTNSWGVWAKHLIFGGQNRYLCCLSRFIFLVRFVPLLGLFSSGFSEIL